MARFTYNARTGVLSGLQGITLGTPAQSIEQYVTTYISNNAGDVYDSDLVIATILKNLDIAALSSLGSGGGGGGAAGITDSDLAVVAKLRNDVDSDSNAIQALSSYLDNQIATISPRIDSVESRIDSDYALTNIKFAALRSDLDSDVSNINFNLNNNVAGIYNLLDSESQKVQALNTRVYTVVKNNDSDHNRRISFIESRYVKISQFDSERVRTQRLYRYVLGDDLGQPPTDGSTLWQNIYDSDTIITTITKGYNPLAATYDSDLVVATINKNLDIASLSNISTGAIDSDQVYNMGFEHGWFYDSDRVMTSVGKNFSNIINIINNNLGKVDSDLVFSMLDSEEVLNMFEEHGLAYQTALDSESTEIRLLRADVDALVAGTYNDAPLVARLNGFEADLDSETARIQLLFSNADSDTINIAQLRRDADSDSVVIQSLREQANLDAAYITLIRNDLDSDDHTIQSLSTRLDTVEATDTIQNSKLNSLEARADSDELIVQSIQTQIDNLNVGSGFDSDQIEAMINEHATSFDDSTLVARLDSDSTRIQNLQTQINNLVDDTGFDSDQIESMINEHVTPYDDSGIIARLDSDSTRIQDLQTQIDNIDVASLRSRLDSDSIIIQAIRTSVDSDYDLFNTKIALFNGLTDSDLTTVANLRNDLDSDSIRIQDLQTQINNLVDDTGFDSDQVVSIINENVTPYDDSTLVARLDSDETIIQSLQTQIDVLVAGTYDDSAVVARLDSDTTAIQDISSRVTVLEAAVDDTGFDSDQIESMINEHVTPYDDSAVVARLDSDELIVQSLQTQIDFLTARLDSDTTVIQSLQTQLDGFDVADIRARLDSDSIAIQSIRTSVDSDYALFNTKISLFNGLTDSDLTTVSILRNDLDSESIEIRALRSDVDSDSAVIQELKSNLIDSDFITQRTPLRLSNVSFTTTSSNQVLDTYDTNEFNTVKYIISARKNTDWQSSECLINHDGTTAYITEYALIDSGAGDLYIPDVDISGSAVRLLVTPQITNIDVSIIRTQIT